MYAATEVGGAARSMDAGRTWEIINDSLVGEDLLDLHTVAVGSPNWDTVFLANRYGVFRSRDGVTTGRTPTWRDSRPSSTRGACG